MSTENNRLTHEFGPFFDENSEILILGSFPSVKSRKQQFYYGHPQNRFWKLLAILFETKSNTARINKGKTEAARTNKDERDTAGSESENYPRSIEERKEFLAKNHIALWDVIESCEITGSSDASIKNAVINDLSMVIPKTKINRILINGGLAFRLFEKHMASQALEFGIPKERCFKMPSTSPANAAYSLERLVKTWSEGLRV